MFVSILSNTSKDYIMSRFLTEDIMVVSILSYRSKDCLSRFLIEVNNFVSIMSNRSQTVCLSLYFLSEFVTGFIHVV